MMYNDDKYRQNEVEVISLKYYIKSMSSSQMIIIRNLEAHTDEIIEHIIKLVLMPGHSARNHWKSEIAAQIKSVKKLDGKNRFPTADQLYAWTYKKDQDLVTDEKWMKVTIEEIEDEYNIEVTDTVNSICVRVDEICQNYFKWLADELSDAGKVTSSRIYQKLDELL